MIKISLPHRIAAIALGLGLGMTVQLAAPRDVAAGAVNNCGTNCQDIGVRAEDSSSSTTCYGACGYGCSYNCSSGGACTTHDYNARTYGLFSSQSLSTFAPAALQWGRCMTGRGTSYVSSYIKSQATTAERSSGSKVSGI